MENVILIIHLLLALALIGVVLLQRSEGGGLGMGSGGGAISARGAATALGKVTWILAIGFICTSIALTLIAAEKSAGSSVMDRYGDTAPAAEEAPASELDKGNLLPPATDSGSETETPLVPKAD